MRRVFVCAVAVGCVLVPTTGWGQNAEPSPKERADELVREGNALGQSGDLHGAIEKFRAAEALFPRALHDCNTGLAHARLRNWERAHYFLTRCRARWPAQETQPAWLASNLKQIESALAAGAYARITLHTSPSGGTVVVAPFPGREVDGEIWLKEGTHTVTASSEGTLPTERTITVTRGQHRTIDIVLQRPAPAAGPETEATATLPAPIPERTDTSASTGPSGTAWWVAATTTSAAGVGLIALGFLFRSAAADGRDELADINRQFGGQDGGRVLIEEADEYRRLYDAEKSDLDRDNALMVSSWAVGGAALLASGYLWWRALRTRGGVEQPSVAMVPTRTGGRVEAAWHF